MSRKVTAAARVHHARYEYLFVRADGEELREITRLVESGAIKPLVEKVFPLDRVAAIRGNRVAAHAPMSAAAPGTVPPRQRTPVQRRTSDNRGGNRW